jgi:hypothetical protein
MYLRYTIAYLLVAIFSAILQTVGVCKIIISHRRKDAYGKTSSMFILCAGLCVVTPCGRTGRPETFDKDIPLTSSGLKTELVSFRTQTRCSEFSSTYDADSEFSSI